MSNSLFGSFLDFYKISEPDPSQAEKNKDHYKRLMLSTFCTATLGYGMYYVCRLSMNVIRKPIVDEGLFSETQLGLIGSSMLFVYAIGNGLQYHNGGPNRIVYSPYIWEKNEIR